MRPLEGKCCLVTGASGGIGSVIAAALAADGAAVALSYGRSRGEADAAVERITAAGGRAVAVQADLADVAAIRRMFAEAVAALGRLDVFISNAGVAKAGSVAEMSEADFDAVMGVNVRGSFFALQEAARHIAEGGRIVNISSSTAAFPAAGMAAYAASKAAVRLFTEVLAKELGGKRVTVNSVLPGPTVPGMFEKAPEQFRKAAEESSPLKRLGRPEDVAAVVRFLATDAAGWVTGQHILVNGGASV